MINRRNAVGTTEECARFDPRMYAGMSYEAASREAERLIATDGWFKAFERLATLRDVMNRHPERQGDDGIIILDDRAFGDACERLAIAAVTAKNEEGLRILWQPAPADVKKAVLAALQSLAPAGETVAEPKG